MPAPPVIEFDADGNVVQTWGGPGEGYEWPQQVHGITVDAKDRIWVSGNGERDTHILAFSRAGKFLSQIGRPGQSGGSHITAHVSQATQMRVDPRSNELYVSDGETNRNHRVIVFDSETGAYKRHWGAYGEKPDDAAAAAKPDPAGPRSKAVRECRALPANRSRRPRLCVRSEQQPIPDLSEGRRVSEGDLRREDVGGRRGGGGPRFLARSEIPIRCRRRESESLDPSSRSTPRCWARSASAVPARASLRRHCTI